MAPKVPFVDDELSGHVVICWCAFRLSRWSHPAFSEPRERGLTLRVLLRNRETGLYFQTPDKWTTAPRCALDFESSARALKKVIELRLQNMDIVLSFGNPAYDV